jgi:hypothetical protein
MHMETGLENVPETIECDGYVGGESDSWPNISGAKFTGFDLTDEEDPYGNKKYSYTFNNSWKKKVTFCLELIGQEFEYLQLFKIVKITTKK